MTANEVVNMIKEGGLDCNCQQLFFSDLIKGLLVHLNHTVSVRSIPVPHMIMNTGDDTMWLLEKEYDYSREPYEVTNEKAMYNIVPRCTVNPQSVDIQTDQLTNPYCRGQFQITIDDQLYTLNGEFRRVPIKLGVELKYYLDSFHDMLELIQHVITKLSFIQTYTISYMGQLIRASYHIPESLDGEHMTDMDGSTQDSKLRTVTLTIEVESNLPVFDPPTVMEPKFITHPIQTLNTGNKASNEITTRDLATSKGYRGNRFGKR